MKRIVTVMHMSDTTSINVRNIKIFQECGIRDVFILSHGGTLYDDSKNLNVIALMMKMMGFWVGCNYLQNDVEEELAKFPIDHVDAIWYDNSWAGIKSEWTKHRWNLKLKYSAPMMYGGVAFKYCPQPKSLQEACDVAVENMDVIVTSGNGTGEAADIEKINTMKRIVNGRKPLAIASGITPENINDYDCDIVMVNTGISDDFYSINESKLKRLIKVNERCV